MFGELKFTLLATGKNKLTLSGTVQLRVIVAPLPPNVPPKNQVGPRWPTIQFSPVVSSSGLFEVGIESAHCHHWALSLLNPPDSADAMFGCTARLKPKAIVANK